MFVRRPKYQQAGTLISDLAQNGYKYLYLYTCICLYHHINFNKLYMRLHKHTGSKQYTLTTSFWSFKDGYVKEINRKAA